MLSLSLLLTSRICNLESVFSWNRIMLILPLYVCGEQSVNQFMFVSFSEEKQWPYCGRYWRAWGYYVAIVFVNHRVEWIFELCCIIHTISYVTHVGLRRTLIFDWMIRFLRYKLLNKWLLFNEVFSKWWFKAVDANQCQSSSGWNFWLQLIFTGNEKLNFKKETLFLQSAAFHYRSLLLSKLTELCTTFWFSCYIHNYTYSLNT